LHFQLQDGPRFEQSWGVEAVFSEMRVSRKGAPTVERDYILRTGDRVQAPR
jgi:hypothetical protein